VGLADIYDRIIAPGENAIQALLRTFTHWMPLPAPPSPAKTGGVR